MYASYQCQRWQLSHFLASHPALFPPRPVSIILISAACPHSQTSPCLLILISIFWPLIYPTLLPAIITCLLMVFAQVVAPVACVQRRQVLRHGVFVQGLIVVAPLRLACLCALVSVLVCFGVLVFLAAPVTRAKHRLRCSALSFYSKEDN